MYIRNRGAVYVRVPHNHPLEVAENVAEANNEVLEVDDEDSDGEIVDSDVDEVDEDEIADSGPDDDADKVVDSDADEVVADSDADEVADPGMVEIADSDADEVVVDPNAGEVADYYVDNLQQRWRLRARVSASNGLDLSQLCAQLGYRRGASRTYDDGSRAVFQCVNFLRVLI